MSYPPNALYACASSARALQLPMSDESTPKKSDEPSAESLAEMPEIDLSKNRVLGRGRHVGRRAGELVRIEPELWPHFGSAEAVNKALRDVVDAKRRAD